MAKTKRRIKLGRRVARLLDIPEETLTGDVKTTLWGSGCALIENHRGVYVCTAEEVRFKTPGGAASVRGTGLVLMEISPERGIVEGEIFALDLRP